MKKKRRMTPAGMVVGAAVGEAEEAAAPEGAVVEWSWWD